MIPRKVLLKIRTVQLVPGEEPEIMELHDYILNPSRNLMCVNDVNLKENRYEALRDAMHRAFEKKFPSKSRFEK